MDYAMLDMRVTDVVQCGTNFSESSRLDSNPMLSKAKLRVGYADENIKQIDITKDAYEFGAQTLCGSPIVAFFFPNGQIGGHEGDMAKTNIGYKETGKPIPYGFASPEQPYWELYDGKEYYTVNVYLWTGRFPESYDIMNASQSMEIKKLVIKLFRRWQWAKACHGKMLLKI